MKEKLELIQEQARTLLKSLNEDDDNFYYNIKEYLEHIIIIEEVM